MKNINKYINEKLHITSKIQYSCQPKTKKELQEIIIQRIKEDGPDCDLNDIDVSKIDNMSLLFCANNNFDGNDIFKDFNGDISRWNVSNVTNMTCMFYSCEKFNSDISKWDISKVKLTQLMFYECKEFNCDIRNWDVSNIKNMTGMFLGCEKFNCNVSQWNIQSAKDITNMFRECKNFKQNLDRWDVSNVENMIYTFKDCPTKPKWYDKDKCE